MNKLVIILALAVALYFLAQTAPTSAPSNALAGQGCVEGYRAEYAPDWAAMTPLQRLVVGALAAGCAP